MGDQDQLGARGALPRRVGVASLFGSVGSDASLDQSSRFAFRG